MKCIVLAALILSTVPAFADTVTEFTANAKEIPQALLSKGYSRIGNVELNQLLARIDRLSVQETAYVNHKQDLGNGMEFERNLGEWRRTATGQVAVAAPRWQKTPAEVRPVISLHESLGALGFSDEILTCSGALNILANDEARSSVGAGGIARIEKIAESACKVAGGTTGVTGGGDDFIAGARVKGMKDAIQSIRAGGDRSQASESLAASLFVSLERKRDFKRQGSIFDPNYRNTQQCLDPSRGIADEATIRVAYNGVSVAHDERNGWTFSESTNCIQFHGNAVHGWAGMSVLYDRKR